MVFVVSLVVVVFPSARELVWVFAAWSIGAGAACLLGVLRVLRLDKGVLSVPIDWRWIASGVKIAFPLLIASLAIRGLFTFDRYWVESVAGYEVLGAYVLYIGIATSIISIIDAGVVVYLYPQVVAAAKANDGGAFVGNMKKLFVNIVVVTAVLVGGALLINRPVLSWIGKDVYMEHLYLLKWLLLAVTIYALSIVPHVGLYARHQDKTILYSQLFGLAVFFCGVLLGASQYGVAAVPWSLCISFASILIWKSIAYQVVGGCKGISA